MDRRIITVDGISRAAVSAFSKDSDLEGLFMGGIRWAIGPQDSVRVWVRSREGCMPFMIIWYIE